jgi:hypothetical protein
MGNLGLALIPLTVGCHAVWCGVEQDMIKGLDKENDGSKVSALQRDLVALKSVAVAEVETRVAELTEVRGVGCCWLCGPCGARLSCYARLTSDEGSWLRPGWLLCVRGGRVGP